MVSQLISYTFVPASGSAKETFHWCTVLLAGNSFPCLGEGFAGDAVFIDRRRGLAYRRSFVGEPVIVEK